MPGTGLDCSEGEQSGRESERTSLLTGGVRGQRPLHVTELVLGKTQQIAQLDVEPPEAVAGLVVQD